MKDSAFRATRAEVNLASIQANFRTLSGKLGTNAFVCPMIKADAYGHGAVAAAKTLRAAGAKHLGVNLLEEAIQLREAGEKGELLTFSIFDGPGAEAVLEHGLTPVLGDWRQLEALAAVLRRRSGALAEKLKIHLKFNTGMNRLGFDFEDARKVREFFDGEIARAAEVAGVCTHLLHGEDAGLAGGESEAQFVKLREASAVFEDLHPIVHALNSSAIVNLSAVQGRTPGAVDPAAARSLGARPGIGIYGANPANNENADAGLRPALSLKSHVAVVRKVRNGSAVSYGPTWRAERDSVIGILPIGYADGFLRVNSNRAPGLCRGMRVKQIGTVCMDFIAFDLTDVNVAGGAVEAGEEIVLIGEQGRERITAVELAQLNNTISYEVFTSLSKRVPRVYT